MSDPNRNPARCCGLRSWQGRSPEVRARPPHLRATVRSRGAESVHRQQERRGQACPQSVAVEIAAVQPIPIVRISCCANDARELFRSAMTPSSSATMAMCPGVKSMRWPGLPNGARDARSRCRSIRIVRGLVLLDFLGPQIAADLIVAERCWCACHWRRPPWASIASANNGIIGGYLLHGCLHPVEVSPNAGIRPLSCYALLYLPAKPVETREKRPSFYPLRRPSPRV